MNKGCDFCLFKKQKVWQSGYWEYVCNHPDNIKTIRKWNNDFIKYLKSPNKLNKKRDCQNYKERT